MIYSRTITTVDTAPASPAAPVRPVAGPSALERSMHGPETPFTRWLVRWRFWFFAGIALLIILQFNGQWRVGLDSSIYRGVGDNLAAGHGYTFAGRRQTQIYPGLPFLIAALQRILHTTSVVPVLVVMNGLALLTLAGVYQLIKLRYPLWIAVAVTCGVGLNSRFVQQSQEVMADAPFLAAVVAAMLGWELLGLVNGRRRQAGAVALLAGGLFVAATMRPTFWVLAAAWAVAALWNVVVRREKRSAIALGVLVVVGVAFMALDPRVHGMSLLQGTYEKQLLQNLSGVGTRMIDNLPDLLRREVPEAFFGESMSGKSMSSVGMGFAIVLLAGAAIVTWRQPLWGLQVFILTAIMLALSDVPRYYLMVLPTLWLGYLLALLLLTARLRPLHRDIALFLMLSLVNVQNLGGQLRLVSEQHARNFDSTYKHGSYVPLRQMAAVLAERMKPGEVAVGPSGQVLTYFSGRSVVNGRLLGFETQPVGKYPQLIAAANPTYVVGPLSAYEKKDTEMSRLLAAGVIVPGKLLAKTDDLWLAEARVHVPDGDWRKQPRVMPRPLSAATRPAARSAAEQANREIKAKRQRKAVRANRIVEQQRRERKLRRQRRATTEPVSSVSLDARPFPTTLWTGFTQGQRPGFTRQEPGRCAGVRYPFAPAVASSLCIPRYHSIA